MHVLVTGVAGFAGRHLARDLRAAGHTVAGYDCAPPDRAPAVDVYIAGDIGDRQALDAAVAAARPDAAVHLCGRTFVPESWEHPDDIVRVNLLGTLALLEACRRRAPAARVLVVSSAEVYGTRPRPAPVAEDAPLDPDNPYAISKAAADLFALRLAAHHRSPVMTVRPGNHIGPGQRGPFAVASFAAQVAAIRRGDTPAVLRVGNLDSRRDFTDVRDVVRAYRLLLERGRPGLAYNLSSGRQVTLRAILDDLCALSGLRPAIETDPARYRPAADRPCLDTRRIAADTGWTAAIPLAATLRDLLEDACGAVP